MNNKTLKNEQNISWIASSLLKDLIWSKQTYRILTWNDLCVAIWLESKCLLPNDHTILDAARFNSTYTSLPGTDFHFSNKNMLNSCKAWLIKDLM